MLGFFYCTVGISGVARRHLLLDVEVVYKRVMEIKWGGSLENIQLTRIASGYDCVWY